MAILDLYKRWVKETGNKKTHITIFDDGSGHVMNNDNERVCGLSWAGAISAERVLSNAIKHILAERWVGKRFRIGAATFKCTAISTEFTLICTAGDKIGHTIVDQDSANIILIPDVNLEKAGKFYRGTPVIMHNGKAATIVGYDTDDDTYVIRFYIEGKNFTQTEDFSENMFTAIPNSIFEEQMSKLVLDNQ